MGAQRFRGVYGEGVDYAPEGREFGSLVSQQAQAHRGADQVIRHARRLSGPEVPLCGAQDGPSNSLRLLRITD